MKRVLYIGVLLIASACCFARNGNTLYDRKWRALRGFGEPRYQVSCHLAYGYNRTYASYGSVDIKGLAPLNEHFEIEGKAQLAFTNIYTIGATLRPKFVLPAGEIFIDGSILYKAVVRNRINDLAGALSVGYRMDYVSAQFGMFGRLMSYMDKEPNSDESYNAEPFNFLYRIEVFCRPQENKWNISACISNSDDYQYERMWQPIFMLGGRYDIKDHWRVQLDAQCKPTGIFHLNATFYGVVIRGGFTYLF